MWLSTPALLFGQGVALRFEEAATHNISIQQLDSLYLSALSEDSAKSVFSGREDEFYKGYVSLLRDLNHYLRWNKFMWTKPVKCFNRIYFSTEGKIDYFLFNFKKGELTNEDETEFTRLVKSFIKDYQFPLTSQTRFAQCSPVTYKQ